MPSFGTNYQDKEKRGSMSDSQIVMRMVDFKVSGQFTRPYTTYDGYSLTLSRLALTLYIPYICLSIKFVKQSRASSSLRGDRNVVKTIIAPAAIQ